MTHLDLHSLARALGGEVSGGQVRAPGPDHSPEDRSLAIKLAPDHREGFVVHSHAGDDDLACRDYVRAKIGLPEYQPGETSDAILGRMCALAAGGPSQTRGQQPEGDHWRPMFPVPEDAPDLTSSTLQRFAPHGYVVGKSWRYLDQNGRLLGYAVRFDRLANGTADKQVKPVTFCEGPDSRREWRSKGFREPRPLYGLDRLASRPGAPVLIVEGEKTADAASIRFPDYVALTSPGGSKAAHKADWEPLAGRDVVIWRDADPAGVRYADDVADEVRRVGVRSARAVTLPPELPEGWDLADELPAGLKDADLSQALANAPGATSDNPLPLFPPLPAAEPYPVHALGSVLSRAASAISRKVQAPEAIAAQSVLAAASLAAQAHADVVLPYGQARPLSLYFVTVAASGDRKSTADNEALWPIRKRERTLKEEHDREFQAWAIESAAWNAERKKIESDHKLDFEGRKLKLTQLGPEPLRPLHPFLTAPDPTIEGLIKAWVSAPAALGVFTAEGGQFVGGHGMSQDHRLKTAAMFSEIWDGHPIKRIRAADGVNVLHGRRLSMHLMVQPDAASGFLADALLRDQGLLSRVLVAAPDSIAGKRLYRETAADDDSAIKAYGARLLAILEGTWPLADGHVNELAPRPIPLSDEAAVAWRAFYNHVEGQCGPNQELRAIRDFAAKAAEHAARIAGVLTIVEDVRATEIGMCAMANALALADWYVNEAARLQRAARTDAKLLRAQQLLEWMQERDSELIEFRDIMRLGPAPVRTKAAADEAVSLLTAHGWVTEIVDRPRRLSLVRDRNDER